MVTKKERVLSKGVESDGSLYDSDDLARVARLLDEVAAEASRYRRFMLAQKLIIEPILSNAPAFLALDPDEVSGIDASNENWDDDESRAASRLPLLEGAAWAAMRYHVDLTIDGKLERARLEPHFKGPDSKDPLDTKDQKEAVVDAWRDLSKVVTLPGAQAVLSHLVFQAAGGREYAQNAATAYIELSETDARPADIVMSARTAVRLARAIGDKELGKRSIEAVERAAEVCITGTRKSVGGAELALGTLLRENSGRSHELVEKALSAWGVEHSAQKFWHLKLQLAINDVEREKVWRDRVGAAIVFAEASESNILKATRLRDVLALAEASGIADLREQAAVLIQGIRNMDLGMMHIRASSYQFEEQFEEMVASVLDDPDAGDFTMNLKSVIESVSLPETDGGEDLQLPVWYLRLRAFAHHGPPTGDPDQNREHTENQYRLAPLQHLFPTQLQTPEGLPLYAPATEEERFDLDMVKWETTLLQQWTVIYADALHRVTDPEVPPFEALVSVLSGGNEPSSVGRQLAESFLRYWAGDGAGALYTAVPMIEALVREAVIRADRGIFRLQKNQSPGQYVGLGVLLEAFYSIYNVPEKDQRFFNAVLKHPGGWNLRNLLSHGYLPSISGRVAALALYSALRVLVLSDNGAPVDYGEGSTA